MKRFTTTRVALLLVALSPLALLTVPGVEAAPETTFAVEALRTLQTQYSEIDSAHLRATLKTWIEGNESLGVSETVGDSSFEYWADGDRYCIRDIPAANLGLVPSYELAFDGTQFQMLDFGMETLSLGLERPTALPNAFPNPLFLPLDFVSADDDSCSGCRIDLMTVADKARWDQRLAGAESVKPNELDLSDLVLKLPGGHFQGQPFHFRISLDSQVGQLLPVQIDRYTDDGRIMGRVVLMDYELIPSGSVQIPVARTIALAVADYEGDGRQIMFTEVTVEELELNGAVEEEHYTIDFKKAAVVWDNATGQFLMHKSLPINDHSVVTAIER